MLIAETDPVLIKLIKENNLAAIIKWFEQRKDSLYKLARTYLHSSSDIQDVFYTVMFNLQADIRKIKKNPDLEKWVISQLLQECKNRNNFEELDDSLVLSYVLGLSQKEVSEILGISVESVKARLHKGIQSLSGSKEAHYQDKFIDYLSRTLDRTEKIELEIHLHTCQSCQQSLAGFQNAINSLIKSAEEIEVPGEFLDPVITALNKIEEDKRNKKKKRTTIGVGIASSLLILFLIGYASNAFAYIYYSWLDWRDLEDEQLLDYLKSGIGEPLDLVQESNGIKVTIKSAIADEFQTLIYYEVENLEEEEQYGINFWDGVYVEKEFETFDQQAYPVNHLPVQPLDSDGTIFKGTLSLLPVTSEAKSIKLNISKLQKIGEDPKNPVWMAYNGQASFEYGKWNFEIPVKKQASIERPVNKKVTVDGVPIEFEKLIITPTLTALQYRFKPYTVDKNINELFFEGIQTKEKTAKPISYGWNFPIESNMNEYFTFHSVFDSLYFDNPKEVRIPLHSLSYYMNDFYNVDIDMNQPFPQTFEYLGSKISIDKVDLGIPTKIEITTEMSEERKFESIDFSVVNNDAMGVTGIEGVLVDRKGNIFNREEYDYYANMDVIDKPRHYQTKMFIELQNEISAEEIIPGWLSVRGYQGTTYLDEVINLDLK
ncbi:DUF4179 domain-containing protein [Fredinandcohnia sp. QZ13]|uniref:DUF4179 domain-containing protein n=1 Tax=Fredinandcohnia sp. QZ13 TaxID=3073144 RepID=UPI0028533D2D|nr:DUF4179 domain-containing protein [Fredinandcohnia sp. QZ13]MDR4886149.1 DUF4179 domain-containing protein [Fredinandcohnia sp. QZ13]